MDELSPEVLSLFEPDTTNSFNTLSKPAANASNPNLLDCQQSQVVQQQFHIPQDLQQNQVILQQSPQRQNQWATSQPQTTYHLTQSTNAQGQTLTYLAAPQSPIGQRQNQIYIQGMASPPTPQRVTQMTVSGNQVVGNIQNQQFVIQQNPNGLFQIQAQPTLQVQVPGTEIATTHFTSSPSQSQTIQVQTMAQQVSTQQQSVHAASTFVGQAVQQQNQQNSGLQQPLRTAVQQKVTGNQTVTINAQQIVTLVQQMQQQLQQHQASQQTPQTQQKILDLQDKIQKLKLLQQKVSQPQQRAALLQQKPQQPSTAQNQPVQQAQVVQIQNVPLLQSPQRAQQQLLQQLQKQQNPVQVQQIQPQQPQQIRLLAPQNQVVQQIISQPMQIQQGGFQVLQIQQAGQAPTQKIVISKQQLQQMQQGLKTNQVLTLPSQPGQVTSVSLAQPNQTVKLITTTAQTTQVQAGKMVNIPISQMHGQNAVIRTIVNQPATTQQQTRTVSIAPSVRKVAPVLATAGVRKATPVSTVQVTAQPGQTLTLMTRPRLATTPVNTLSTESLQTMQIVSQPVVTTIAPTTGVAATKGAPLKTLLPAKTTKKSKTTVKTLLPATKTPSVVTLYDTVANSSRNDVVVSTTSVSSADVHHDSMAVVNGGDIVTSAAEEVVVDTTPSTADASAANLSPVKTAQDQKAKQKAARFRKQQEKANRIIMEAIKKAKEEGRELPPHNEPVLPDSDGEDEEDDEKPKKKRAPKPKGEKKPKAEKPKKEKKEKPKAKPAKKKASKKKTNPVALMEKRMKKKRARNFSEEGVSDTEEMREIVEAANTRKFYIPSDDDFDGFKRRSGRHTNKRKKYMDEPELDLSEEDSDDVDVDDSGPQTKKQKTARQQTADQNDNGEHFFVDNPAEDESQVVEKILGMRIGTRSRVRPDTDVDILGYDDIEIPQETVHVEEFYVKYKNYSYLHCEWKTDDELKGDKRIQMKIRRFKQKQLPFMDRYLVDEEDLFNQDYIEVDRVLEKSVTREPPNNEEVTYYLVKWRSLQYEEATWELEQDVDNDMISSWSKHQLLPPEDEREAIARPRPNRWEKMESSPIYNNDNVLREYQLEGVNWLTFCYYNRQNCILADEMGLGKTIQSISFLKAVYDYGIHGPFLVIVPLSTLANWQREFDLWTDMNAVVYHGSTASRRMIMEYELYFKDENGAHVADTYKFHALITTYEIVISDVDLLSTIEWRVAVIDEAHRLKNKNCKLAEGLKCFEMEHKVLLTGTPLQNNVEELFSLLNFLEPQRFNNVDEFLKDFGELRTESQVKQLKSLLKPMMLRRLKEDVEKSLAPKEETIVEVELTNTQKKYYRAILERNFAFLSKGGTTSNVPNLMNTMMELRKCCNHPYLIDGAEQAILAETRERHGDHSEMSLYALVNSCGKLVLIDKLLPKLFAGNHRVLVFSQMIRVLDILEDYLIQKRYLYERLDGRIRGNHRQEAIDRFSKPDSDRFVFLLCTRAGGLGINLTAADTVIIYDSDWNPQNDLQAQARCHRIGQQKAVKIYRLITRNSYEREMFDKASLKLGLDKAVLQSTKDKDESNPSALSKRDIEDLLKRGAYGAVMDEEHDGDKFCEEDIDLILQRRTHVVQIGNEGKGSVFAKASFSASANRNDIDIDDPQFWEKWAKKAEIDPEAGLPQYIMEEPRKRKQTARYGNQDDILKMSGLDTSSDSDKDSKENNDDSKKKVEKKKKIVKRRRRHKEPQGPEEPIEPTTPAKVDCYVRSEMFKVEKLMLVYGWGRWYDILSHARFRRRLGFEDVEKIAKAMLLYSLRYYAGDGRIKRFIYDLVNPHDDIDYRNHQGLSAPVPRGRKGKKNKEKAQELSEDLESSLANCDIDPDVVLCDEGYKKHLQRHSNKVLLRVRLLYYLKQEVIGDENADMITAGVPADVIDIPPPGPECNIRPTSWWDDEADKSLLIGVFKHGYEKFNAIRQDPCLCFFERCGPPDGKALAREQNDDEDYDNEMKASDTKLNSAADAADGGGDDEDDNDDLDLDASQSELFDGPRDSQNADKHGDGDQSAQSDNPTVDGKLSFPSFSDLNTRLRRVITGYQKLHKRHLHKMEKHEKKRERIEAVTKERELKKRESQQRWSRREETDFYRIVSTYGVEYDADEGRYRWDQFRCLARLEKKYDDTMTDYFLAFYYMCCRVCNRLKENAQPPNDQLIEPITEERATRCLARIDLLNKIREETLLHPELDERLAVCERGHDMPDWWQPGRHDKDLLIGAATHGLARTDYHILHDPDLSFKEIVQNKSMYIPPSHFPGSHSRPGRDDSDDDDEPEARGTTRPSCPDTSISVKSESKSDSDNDDDSVSQHCVKREHEVTVKVEVKQEEVEIKQEEVEIKQEEVEIKQEEVEMKELHDNDDDAENNSAMKGGEAITVRQMVDKIKANEQNRCNSPSKDLDLDMDADSHEPTVAELLAKNVAPAIHWPKDRTIFHRLEQVCSCVDHAEWPHPRRRHYDYTTHDSLTSTPCGTPKPCATPGIDRSDTPEFYAQHDGLKLTIGKKKRRSKPDFDDGDSHHDGRPHFMNGDSDNEYSRDGFDSPYPGKKKRGRKSKVEKLLLEAAERRENIEKMIEKAKTRIDNFDDPELHVPVVNLESGDRLSGDEAPLRRYLPGWLDKNPGYIIDLPYDPEDDADSKWAKKPRRHKIDPTKLDLEALTGEENVSVVNTVTGKRVTGAKAPELRYLARFLEHNPNYYVDSKWAHLVRTKANLPDKYLSRILPPPGDKKLSVAGGTGAMPRLPQHTHPLMQQYPAALAMSNSALLNAAALGGGVSLMSGLSNSLMLNPSMFGLQVDDSKNEEAVKTLLKAAIAQKGHGATSVPMLSVYNPMLMSPLMSPGLTGFSIPASITTNMTMSEAQAALLNGNIVIDDKKRFVHKSLLRQNDLGLSRAQFPATLSNNVLVSGPRASSSSSSGGGSATPGRDVMVRRAVGEVVMEEPVLVHEEVVGMETVGGVEYMDDVPGAMEEVVISVPPNDDDMAPESVDSMDENDGESESDS